MSKKPHELLGNRDWLRARIEEGLSQRQIAGLCSVNIANVAYYVKRHGLFSGLERSERTKAALAERYPNGRRGELAGNWRGGRRSTTGNKPGGYIRLYAPDHPAAVRGWVYEHRLVMEKKLGRLLTRGELVDHIDRNRSNNAPENLRLQASRSQHVKDHFSARDKFLAFLAKVRDAVAVIDGDEDFQACQECGMSQHQEWQALKLLLNEAVA